MAEYNLTADGDTTVTGSEINIVAGNDFGGGTITLLETINGTPTSMMHTTESAGVFSSVAYSFTDDFSINLDLGGKKTIIIRLAGSSSPDIDMSVTGIW